MRDRCAELLAAVAALGLCHCVADTTDLVGLTAPGGDGSAVGAADASDRTTTDGGAAARDAAVGGDGSTPVGDASRDRDARAAEDAEVCAPATCASLGRTCGAVSDGCGGTLICERPGPSRWRLESFGWDDNVAGGVWASSAADVWIVGPYGLKVHYDGCAWTTVSGPDERLRHLFAVYGHGPDDVWAVGTDVVQHWDGRRWSSERSPPLGTFYQAAAFAPSGAGDFVAVGVNLLGEVSASVVDRLAVGRAPAPLIGPRFGSLTSVWSEPSGRFWVAGAAGDIQYYDGTWHDHSQPMLDQENVMAIHGSAPDDVWAATSRGHLVHWDGRAWTPMISPTSRAVTAIFAIARDDVVLAEGTGAVFRWDGRAWTRVPVRLPESNLRGIWATDADHIWVIGNGAFLRYTP